MTGYGGRTTESEGVEQRLWARAVALGDDRAGAYVLVTADLCGVPAELCDEVGRRLESKAGIARERFVLSVTHTHSGPVVAGYAPMIFAEPPPPDQQERIDTYTRILVDRIEQVGLEALSGRVPCALGWGQGTVGFAANRRVVKDGRWEGFGVAADAPVDRELPVLSAVDAAGKVRAVLVGYACHCTTLGGDFNKICGDWAGYACEALERELPGAVPLIVIGCAADANPEPRGALDMAKAHGEALAKETMRVMAGSLAELPRPSEGHASRIELPFDRLPTRDEWQAAAQGSGHSARRARGYVERIDRGETIAPTLPYRLQAWCFGDELCMMFLPGEVVVDYATLLRSKLDARKLWIVAYANGVPCYIPSKRILREGGYEAVDSMIYYDRPSPLAPETEDRIVEGVVRLVPDTFVRRP